MKRNERGFTLAELLIVVAIIGVLVAVSIPIFANQLEKSRESTDLANVRAAYAEVMTAAITDDMNSPMRQADGTFQATVSLVQKIAGWTINTDGLAIGQVNYGDVNWKNVPQPDGKCIITYTPSSGMESDSLEIDWGGGSTADGGGQPDDSGNTQGGSSSGSASFPDSTKDSIIEALKNLIKAEDPHGSQTVTININSGEVTIDFHGNKHESVTEASVMNMLSNVDGVSFDGNGRMLYNGELMTDKIEYHFKPNGKE